MGIYSILEAFDDSSCFHYFIRKTMNQVSTKNTNKNKRSIHPNLFNCSIPVFIEQNPRAKFFISQEYPNFWLWFEASLVFDILIRDPRTRAGRQKNFLGPEEYNINSDRQVHEPSGEWILDPILNKYDLKYRFLAYSAIQPFLVILFFQKWFQFGDGIIERSCATDEFDLVIFDNG